MPHAIPVEGNYYTDPGNIKMFPESIQTYETTGNGFIPDNQVVESETSIQRLSYGYRVDRPAADLAGLAVGKILQTNVQTLKAALAGSAEANSMLGIANGAVKNLSEILERLKKLPSANTITSMSEEARTFLDKGFKELLEEVDKLSLELSVELVASINDVFEDSNI
jgi:flagellin